MDRARAGDDGVAVGALGLHAERVRAVAHELVELDEGAGVEQLGDALARRHLALGVLLLDRRLAGRGHGFVIALLEVGELAGGRGEVGAVSRFGHAVHSTGEHPGRFVDGFLQIRPPTWCIPVTRGTGRLSAWTFRSAARRCPASSSSPRRGRPTTTCARPRPGRRPRAGRTAPSSSPTTRRAAGAASAAPGWRRPARRSRSRCCCAPSCREGRRSRPRGTDGSRSSRAPP